MSVCVRGGVPGAFRPDATAAINNVHISFLAKSSRRSSLLCRASQLEWFTEGFGVFDNDEQFIIKLTSMLSSVLHHVPRSRYQWLPVLIASPTRVREVVVSTSFPTVRWVGYRCKMKSFTRWLVLRFHSVCINEISWEGDISTRDLLR